MTKAAALDYAKRNIRVNAVGPGPVETPLLVKGTGGDPNSYAAFVPMGRIGQPDEIADAVLWLLSEDACKCHRFRRSRRRESQRSRTRARRLEAHGQMLGNRSQFS